MKKYKPKLSKSKHGVSEIIGNLLILGITVTLFSSILFFVTSLPAPVEATYTDLEANVFYDQPNEYVWINITHKGGQPLANASTGIYIFINDQYTQERYFSDGTPSITDQFQTGMIWKYNQSLTTITTLSRLAVMLVDKNTNSIVWQSDLIGGASSISLPPIIGNRGTDPTTGTTNSSMKLYAYVFDPNNNLNYSGVYIDASYWMAGLTHVQMTYKGNNLFEYEFTSIPYTGSAGITVILSAWDTTGLVSNAFMKVYVLNSNTGGGGGGGSGGPPGNIDYSLNQGFNIFENSDWIDNGYDATPRTAYQQPQLATVVVVSKYLVNTENENTLLVMDDSTKEIYTAVSSPTLTFSHYEYYSGYYVYTADIDTTKIPNNNRYLLQIQLRDNWMPNNIFFANAFITVGNADLPSFVTYSDSTYTTPSKNFTTNDVIYVEVKNFNGGTWDQWGGDVVIRDYFGGEQIKRVPSTDVNNPVSIVTQIGTSNIYRFTIDLKKALQDPWLPGRNSYTLGYDMFKTDGPLEQYSLTQTVYITAPKIKMDLVASVEAGQQGAQFIERNTMYYYKNDNQWYPPDVIQGYSDFNKNAAGYMVTIGDMNGDTKNDMVAVVGDTSGDYEMNLYINDGAWTRKLIANSFAYTPTALVVANFDYDNDLDIILGFENGAVILYRNDGLWTPQTLPSVSSQAVTVLTAGDLDNDRPGNDPYRSMDVLAGRQSNGMTIYKNANLIGTSWTTQSFQGGSTVPVSYVRAVGESTLIGTRTGSYLDTQQLAGEEVITEKVVDQSGYAIPVTGGSENSYGPADSFIPNLQNDDAVYYTVTKNQILNINGWQSTGISNPTGTVTSVVFDYQYYTQNQYDSNDWITWGVGTGHTNNVVQITKSTTLVTNSVTIPVTADIDTLSEVLAMNFYFMNTDGSGNNYNVFFDYWRITITMTGGAPALDQIWTINVSSAGGSASHTLYVRGNTSSEAFNFYYSINGVDYYPTTGSLMTVSSLTIATAIGTIDMASIGAETYTGPLYIKAIDADRTSTDQTLDSLTVQEMWINTTIITATGIGRINGISMSDMNGDTLNDISIIDSLGKFWVIRWSYIAGSYISQYYFTGAPANAVGFGVGSYLGTTYQDACVITSSSVYIINQTSPGVFTTVQLTFVVPIGTITAAVTGDVDGNGRYDFIFGTSSGYIILYRNLNQGSSTTSWQALQVDHCVYSKGDYDITYLSLGKLENF